MIEAKILHFGQMEKTNLKGFCNTSKIVFASLILINSGGINSTFAVQQMFLLQILGIILTYFGIICLGGIWKLQNRGGHHLTVISSERLVDSASGRKGSPTFNEARAVDFIEENGIMADICESISGSHAMLLFISNRAEKKLQVPDVEFSKRKDIYGAWEQYLGLEHDDSAPKKPYAVNRVASLGNNIVIQIAVESRLKIKYHLRQFKEKIAKLRTQLLEPPKSFGEESRGKGNLMACDVCCYLVPNFLWISRKIHPELHHFASEALVIWVTGMWQSKTYIQRPYLDC
ncbi:hypothetical protein JHK84_055239 [Glycine max]|nr:hypothetical protein JHK84_055239 [Glycine max]